MRDSTHKIFEFGPYRLDTAERILLRDGRPVPLTLKAFDVLMLLVENSGHIVEKDELMNRVWAGSFVEEGNLKVTVSMVRKAMEDNNGDQPFIETVPRRGYRFTAKVQEVTAESIDLVVHERTRKTLTIDEVGIVNELPVTQTNRLVHKAKQRKLVLGVTAVLVLIISTTIIFFSAKHSWPKLTARKSPAPFENFKITPLTTSGGVAEAAISPDGKYVAYIATSGETYSLWVRHISTGSDTQVAGPPNGRFGELTFSP